MTGWSDRGPGPLPALHLVTDDQVLARGGFLDLVPALMEEGGAELALHLRGPRTSGRRLYDTAAALAGAARRTGTLLLVNDRVDVATAVGAHGVQLGARSLAAREARPLVGEARWIGASVHGVADAAGAAGADFLVVGTLYPTPSHPGRTAAGPGAVRGLARAGLPLIGIGGITPERVPEVLGAGAAGVAVIRAVWNAPDPRDAVRAFLKALDRKVAHER